MFGLRLFQGLLRRRRKLPGRIQSLRSREPASGENVLSPTDPVLHSRAAARKTFSSPAEGALARTAVLPTESRSWQRAVGTMHWAG